MQVRILENRTVEGKSSKGKDYKFESLNVAIEDPRNPGVFEKGEFADFDCQGYQPGTYELLPDSIGIGIDRGRRKVKLVKLNLRPVKPA